MIEPPRLALKLFRGEPAISGFDWHFTASHSSSPNFSTLVSSVLHEILLSLQTGHGYVTRFRGYCMRLNVLFLLAFATAPSFSDLTSPHASNSSAHSSKGTPSDYRPSEVEPATPSDCLWARGFRYCFTPLIGVLFTFPSRYSFTIGRQEYLALDGGPPGFPHERPSTWYSG